LLKASVILIAQAGCAPHDSFLAHDPLTAIFTRAYIPQLPAPTDPTHYYAESSLELRARVMRAIERDHGVVILAASPETVTFYIDVSWRVLPSQLDNPKQLAELMMQNKDPLVTALLKRFDANDQAELSAEVAGDGKQLVTVLARGLNGVILGPSIYDERLFSGKSLRDVTVECLREISQPGMIERCNRLLLEDGLPDYLTKTSLLAARPALTRFYVTVLIEPRVTSPGSVVHVVTWRNGVQQVGVDYSSELFRAIEG